MSAVRGDRLIAPPRNCTAPTPEEFTERRKALAAAARARRRPASGQGRSRALRKPTRAAWVVNRLARADPSAPARLAALASCAARRRAGQGRPPAA